MLSILEAIENWVKELLISGIEANLARMFGDVNDKVSEIASQVGQTPRAGTPEYSAWYRPCLKR